MINAKKIFCIVVLIKASVLQMAAQNLELSTQIQATNRGYGISINLRQAAKETGVNAIELSYNGIRDHKEVKISNVNLVNPSLTPGAFTFGKINYLQAVRIGLGREKMWAKRPDKNAVAVIISTIAGANLGLQVPVFIDYNTPGANDFGFQTFRYDPAIHQRQDIIQSRSALKGMSKSKILPGLFVKQGLVFEFGNYTNAPNRLEAGWMVDALIKKPEIMYEKKHPNIFLSFYVSFAILNFGI